MPSRRPLRADAVRNQEKLVSAAREVFASEGLDVALEDIARHAGVGIATLYRRFPDRESLIIAMFESKMRDIIAEARTALEIEDPWEAFRRLLTSIFRTVAKDKGMRQLLLSSRYNLKNAETGRAELIGLMGRVIARAKVDGRLRLEIGANDIPPLVLMVGAVADFSAKSEPALWERYATLVFDGLAARSPSAEMKPDALTPAQMSLSMLRW
jgi:AcrR family transcriptional regulator